MGPYNETIGLVTPGDWVDFFRFVGEEYPTGLLPEFDSRNPMALIFPKISIIKEKYDVVFQPQFVGAAVSDWTDEDTKIPDGSQAYFLKANTGPRYLLGGVLSRPFITTKQSDGQFAITSVESSNKYPNGILATPYSFAKVHQVYCVLDGAIRITLNGTQALVRAGETTFIPAGTEISLEFIDNYVRFWSYSSGDGLESLIQRAGCSYEGLVIPEIPREVEFDKMKSVATDLECTLKF